MRDPNERILMGDLVADSPMYDYVEQISGKAPPKFYTQEKPKTKEQIKLEQKQRELEM